MSLTFDSTWLNEQTVAPAKVRPLVARNQFTRSDFARRPHLPAVPVSSTSPDQHTGDVMTDATCCDTQTLHRPVLPADPRLIAGFLREKHPYHTAKLVAADTQATVRTVEGWLQDRPPIWRHWRILCAVYGSEFVARVCIPDSPRHRHERLMARLAAMEEALRAVRAEIGGGG